MAMASYLTEISTSNEEFPSKSTRTSLANLPKLGVFSTSKCTSPIEAVQVVQGHSESGLLKEKPTSKTPSRQKQTKEDSSQTMSTQRLDIRIDLSSSKSAETGGVARDHGNVEEKTHRDRKTKTLPNALQIRNRNKDTKERARTKTWPALHYNLWLDASNLSFDLLTKDERANRPPEYARPHRRKMGVDLEHHGAGSSIRAAKNNKDWSTHFLCVSRPPSNGNSTRMRKCSGVGKSGMEVAVDLQVGVGESWQVTSSYAHKRPQNNLAGEPTSAVCSTMLQKLEIQTRKKPYPRIPSRMGLNNLEMFLRQSITSHSGESKDAERRSMSSELSTLVSPRHFCNTSAELSLLNLRSYGRNPRMLQELNEKEKGRLGQSAAVHKNECTPTRAPSQQLVGGAKQVRFSVPCGNSDEDDCLIKSFKTGVVRTNNSSSLKQTWSDVTPPPTPPSFEQAYRIQNLYTRGGRAGSKDHQSITS